MRWIRQHPHEPAQLFSRTKPFVPACGVKGHNHSGLFSIKHHYHAWVWSPIRLNFVQFAFSTYDEASDYLVRDQMAKRKGQNMISAYIAYEDVSSLERRVAVISVSPYALEAGVLLTGRSDLVQHPDPVFLSKEAIKGGYFWDGDEVYCHRIP